MNLMKSTNRWIVSGGHDVRHSKKGDPARTTHDIGIGQRRHRLPPSSFPLSLSLFLFHTLPFSSSLVGFLSIISEFLSVSGFFTLGFFCSSSASPRAENLFPAYSPFPWQAVNYPSL